MTDTIDLVSREEMERAVSNARKSNKGTNLTGVLVYLGIGCAVQALMYGDVSVNQISNGDVGLIVVAHVLVWWAFVAYHLIKWILIALVIVGVIAGIIYTSDDLRRKFRGWQIKRWVKNHRRV